VAVVTDVEVVEPVLRTVFVIEVVTTIVFVKVGVCTKQLHAGDMIEAAMVEKIPAKID
jgi:hypothetical protein